MKRIVESSAHWDRRFWNLHVTEAGERTMRLRVLASARDAFYALTKPLVRYRFGVSGKRPMVVYCPMTKRSWLQPKGDVANPYHGQAMGACGEIVEE